MSGTRLDTTCAAEMAADLLGTGAALLEDILGVEGVLLDTDVFGVEGPLLDTEVFGVGGADIDCWVPLGLTGSKVS